MKSYTVWATFPFVAAKSAQQKATGRGSSMPVAVRNALAEIVARDGIKGKHMREGEQVTISVTYNGKVDDGQGELQLEGEE